MLPRHRRRAHYKREALQHLNWQLIRLLKWTDIITIPQVCKVKNDVMLITLLLVEIGESRISIIIFTRITYVNLFL